MRHSLHITFLHANGYPAGVYRQFLDALTAHATVAAPAVLDTAPNAPARKRWARMLDHALQSIDNAAPDPRQQRVLVGHSMGGYIALQAAAQHPEQIKQVVLIESPIPQGWQSAVLSFAQLTGLAYKGGPAPVAARRRDSWASREAAYEFFANKPFVQRWAPGVLRDFIDHALVESEAGGVQLRIPRNAERDIYANVVHRKALAAVHKLRKRNVRVSFIAGEHSDELRMAGIASNERLFAHRFQRMPHGHLIPLEAPQVCADAVIRALDR
jgi:pimeloyl-ACP methyl ester carboxylesterase